MSIGEFIEAAVMWLVLAAIWIGIPVYIARKLWRRRKRSRMPLEEVAAGSQRVRKNGPREIDVEFGAGYRNQGVKGEPFMAPGGWLVVIAFIAVGLYGYFGRMLLAPVIEPSVDWLMSFVR